METAGQVQQLSSGPGSAGGRTRTWAGSDRGLHVALAMRRSGIVTPPVHHTARVLGTAIVRW